MAKSKPEYGWEYKELQDDDDYGEAEFYEDDQLEVLIEEHPKALIFGGVCLTRSVDDDDIPKAIASVGTNWEMDIMFDDGNPVPTKFIRMVQAQIAKEIDE
jgi:hypothetical protein